MLPKPTFKQLIIQSTIVDLQILLDQQQIVPQNELKIKNASKTNFQNIEYSNN